MSILTLADHRDCFQDYLATGSIKHSVNFPTAQLEPKHSNVACRLCIINKNEPGMLGQITSILGSLDLNIMQQVRTHPPGSMSPEMPFASLCDRCFSPQLNTSRGKIAYNVVDIEEIPEDPRQLQLELAEVNGILSSRMIVGLPGFGYHSTMMHGDYNYYDT